MRLIRGPDGRVLPDLYGKLPGRGLHLCPDFACFQKAAELKAFTRALRATTRIDDPAALFEVVLESSRAQVRAILSTAARSGWLQAGRTAVQIAMQKKQLALILLATDASPSLRREIEKRAEVHNIPCRTLLSVSDLSRYHRGKPLAVLGIRHRGIARRLDSEIIKANALTTSLDSRHGQLTAPSVRGKMQKKRAGTPSARS